MRDSLKDYAITVGRKMNDKVNDGVDQPSPVTAADAVGAAPVPEPAALPRKMAWFSPWLVVALLAIGLAGWQWVETRSRIGRTQQELAKRLSESDTVAKESRALARQAQEQLAALQAKVGELEGRLAHADRDRELRRRRRTGACCTMMDRVPATRPTAA